MNNYDPIILIALLAVGVHVTKAFYHYFIEKATKKVREFLLAAGATKIEIHQVFDWDRHTLTFNVKYVSQSGLQKTTRCKVRFPLLASDNEIFWADPFELGLLKPVQKGEPSFSENLRLHLEDGLPSYEIAKVIPAPKRDEQIVMLKYTGSFKNILRCRLDGSILWQADLPGEDDVYTNVEWQDGKLNAFSRSCMSVFLDAETGKIISSRT